MIFRSLPGRVVQTFLSPGELVRTLAVAPVWGGALLLGAVLMVAQTALLPAEVWESTVREAVLRQGGGSTEGVAAAVGFVRIAAVVGGTLGYAATLFLFSGIVTLVFAFVLGDEGRYRQYLAVMSHAWIIPAVVGVLLLPLKISQQDPRFSLSVASFLFFLPEGYVVRVARVLDLSSIWAWLVVAQGAHAIDPRRSFAAAASVLMAFLLGLALLVGLIPGT